MYRGEVKLRTNLLGEPAKHIRPLSETRCVHPFSLFRLGQDTNTNIYKNRAIENGANALAEGFLFAVAAGLIIGETWRSSRSQSKRRDDVDDKFEEIEATMDDFRSRMDTVTQQLEESNQRYASPSTYLAHGIQ